MHMVMENLEIKVMAVHKILKVMDLCSILVDFGLAYLQAIVDVSLMRGLFF